MTQILGPSSRTASGHANSPMSINELSTLNNQRERVTRRNNATEYRYIIWNCGLLLFCHVLNMEQHFSFENKMQVITSLFS